MRVTETSNALTLNWFPVAELEHISHYFRSDEVRRAMTFSSMYMGMSPFDAPATYTLLQYAEYAKGVYYPIGGFQTLVAAFEQVARERFGATFLYNKTVTKILTDQDVPRHGKDSSDSGFEPESVALGTQVHGVELADGERIVADVVVSNADLVWTVSRRWRSATRTRWSLYTDLPEPY